MVQLRSSLHPLALPSPPSAGKRTRLLNQGLEREKARAGSISILLLVASWLTLDYPGGRLERGCLRAESLKAYTGTSFGRARTNGTRQLR